MKLNRGKLIRFGFNILAVVVLMGVFICNEAFGQDKKPKIEVINDDNFKQWKRTEVIKDYRFYIIYSMLYIIYNILYRA